MRRYKIFRLGILSIGHVSHEPCEPELLTCRRETLQKSLYERLGGVYNIAPVVDEFLEVLYVDDILNANPKIKEARDRVPKAYLKYHVTSMVCQASGGPEKYTGRGMKESHQHLNITRRNGSRWGPTSRRFWTSSRSPSRSRRNSSRSWSPRKRISLFPRWENAVSLRGSGRWDCPGVRFPVGLLRTIAWGAEGSPGLHTWVPPARRHPQSGGAYFFFPGAFAFSVLTFLFTVFPGGTHPPQPQSVFFAIMSPPFVLSVFLPLGNVGIRRCTALRSLAGAGTPGNSSPPS